MPPSASAAGRRQAHRTLDVSLLVWGLAAATVLATSAANDAREAAGWPRWLELSYLTAVIVAAPALVMAGWAKVRLRRLGAVVDDERTADTHIRSMAAGLVGVLVVQLPFFFQVELPSVAHAKVTVAAALVAYGAARLWFNRES